jgi:hypothetical protein
MAHTKKDLADKIVALATANWAEVSQPLLLSRLGPDLKAKDFDYKEILDGQGLRNFIDKEVGELTVAQHPQQFAKVGVHPASQTFSYSDAIVEDKVESSEFDKLRKNRRAFYGFIQAISELPAEEIEGVNIPARVIVRLLEGK